MGRVLGVGEIPKKIEGAIRNNCEAIILPKENKDEGVEYEDDINIYYVSTIEEAVNYIFF